MLVGRADGHPDRSGGSERGERPDDHAELQQLLEERPRVLADLAVDEVRDRRARELEAVVA